MFLRWQLPPKIRKYGTCSKCEVRNTLTVPKSGHNQGFPVCFAPPRERHGQEAQQQGKGTLSGNVEVDGTSLGFLRVRRHGHTYKADIDKLVHALQEKSQLVLKSFAAHVPGLGAWGQGNGPVLLCARRSALEAFDGKLASGKGVKIAYDG